MKPKQTLPAAPASAPGPTQSRQAEAVSRRSRAGQVTGPLKAALDYMAFECKTGDYEAAAKHAGITAYTVRSALNKTHVKAYYNALLQVLRDGERMRNIKRAIEIRDAADNMPAINAIKWLEGEPEQTLSRGGTAQAPGVTFVIVGSNASVGTLAGTPTAIDANANDINDIDDE